MALFDAFGRGTMDPDRGRGHEVANCSPSHRTLPPAWKARGQDTLVELAGLHPDQQALIHQKPA